MRQTTCPTCGQAAIEISPERQFAEGGTAYRPASLITRSDVETLRERIRVSDWRSGTVLGLIDAVLAQGVAPSVLDTYMASGIRRPSCPRCGAETFRPDSVDGRRQARRCVVCQRVTGRCDCPARV